MQDDPTPLNKGLQQREMKLCYDFLFSKYCATENPKHFDEVECQLLTAIFEFNQTPGDLLRKRFNKIMARSQILRDSDSRNNVMHSIRSKWEDFNKYYRQQRQARCLCFTIVKQRYILRPILSNSPLAPDAAWLRSICGHAVFELTERTAPPTDESTADPIHPPDPTTTGTPLIYASQRRNLEDFSTLPDYIYHLTTLIHSSDHEALSAHLAVQQSVYRDLAFQSFFRELYKPQGYTLLSAGGHDYPSVVFPIRDGIRLGIGQPDPILALQAESGQQNKPPVSVPEYLDYMRASTPNKEEGMYKGDDLVLDHISLSDDKKPRIHYYLSNYFEIVKSSYLLEFEAKWAWARHRNEILKTQARGGDPLEFFPYRQQVHKATQGNPILNGAGRIAGIGVATLLCYVDEVEKHHVLLARRAENSLGTHRGLYHVLPSGMLEPRAKTVPTTGSMLENIWREYVEELFDKEAQKGRKSVDPQWYQRVRSGSVFGRMIKNGSAEIYFTGLTINLLNLCPEICALLLIRDPFWHEEELFQAEINFEVEKLEGDKGKDLTYIPIDQRDEMAKMTEPSVVPPSGAGAIWMGFELAQKLIRKRNP